MPEPYTAKDVAERLGISPEAVRYRSRKLDVGRKAHASVRFYTEQDIERLAAYPQRGTYQRRRHDD